jgi:hypothetical protein
MDGGGASLAGCMSGLWDSSNSWFSYGIIEFRALRLSVLLAVVLAVVL